MINLDLGILMRFVIYYITRITDMEKEMLSEAKNNNNKNNK